MVRREPSEFGKLLRQYRLAAGLSQDMLAERATLSTRAISDLERGVRRSPRYETVELLISAFELSPREQAFFRAHARGEDSTSAEDPDARAAAQPLLAYAGARTLPFIGRAFDLALIDRHLAGQGQPCLLISGEPGIGKTRLLVEAASRAAARGYTVLTGGCLQRHAQEPYAPVTQAIAAFIKAHAPAALQWLLVGCEWLACVLPELADGPLAPLSQRDLAPAQVHRLVVRAMSLFLANAAGAAGVVLLLDDLQWIAADGSDLLADILVQAPEIRLRVIGSYRQTHEPAPLAAATALVTYHQLTPLTASDAAALTGAALEDQAHQRPEVQQAILHRGEGVPLFLVSLAASVRAGASVSALPQSVAQSVRQRLWTLPAGTQTILATAAIGGREIDPFVVREATRSPLAAVLDALDAGCHLSFLVDRGDGGYAFAHDMIRDALEAELTSARRGLVHRQVGTALEQVWATSHPQNDLPVERLAFHFQQSGDAERAITYLMQAAMRSRRAVAHREEAAYLGDALMLAQQRGLAHLVVDLQVRRGMAFFDHGAWAAARLDLEAAATAMSDEPSTQNAHVLVSLATVCHWLFDVPGTRRYAHLALRLAEQLDDRGIAAEAISALAFADSSDGDLAASLKQYDRAFAIAGLHPSPHLVAAREMSALVHYWRGEYPQAIAQGQAALQFARDMGDTTSAARALGNLGLALTGVGRYGEALAMFSAARRFCQEFGLQQWLARATSMEGSLRLALRDLGTAESLAEEALEIADAVQWPLGVVSAEIDLLLILARRGDPGAHADRLLQEAARAAVTAKGAHGWLWQLRLSQVRAELALAHASWDEAARLAANARALARLHGRVKYEALGLVTCGSALVHQHRDDAALAMLDDAISIARSIQDPALFVYAAAARLAIAPDASLLAEMRAGEQRLTPALASDERSHLAH